METQTTVRSYVRGHKQSSNEVEQPNTMAYVLLALTGIALGLVYWTVTLTLLTALGAAYGLKLITAQNVRAETIEEPVEPEKPSKPKRTYNRRMTINHYQLGGLKV